MAKTIFDEDKEKKKEYVYLTLTDEAYLKFLTHGFIFPIDTTDNIQNAYSLVINRILLFSHNDNKLHFKSGEEREKNAVLVRFFRNDIEDYCSLISLQTDVSYGNALIPVTLIDKVFVDSEESLNLLSARYKNIKREDIDVEKIGHISSRSIVINDLKLNGNSIDIKILYKLVSALITFFNGYRETKKTKIYNVSSYHLSILESIFRDTFNFSEISTKETKKYNELLSQSFYFLLDTINFKTLFKNLENQYQNDKFFDDYILFVLLFKFLIKDFNYDIDARLSFDMREFMNRFKNNVKPELDTISKNIDQLTKTKNTFKFLEKTMFESSISIREHLNKYKEKSHFIAFFPIYMKHINTGSKQSFIDTMENYDLSLFMINLFRSISAFYNGLAKSDTQISEKNQHLFDYFSHLQSIIRNNNSHFKIQQTEFPSKSNAIITYTSKNFPILEYDKSIKKILLQIQNTLFKLKESERNTLLKEFYDQYPISINKREDFVKNNSPFKYMKEEKLKKKAKDMLTKTDIKENYKKIKKFSSKNAQEDSVLEKELRAMHAYIERKGHNEL